MYVLYTHEMYSVVASREDVCIGTEIALCVFTV